MRILHVVHHLGGGLDTAIAAYACATDEFEHHLIFSPDISCRVAIPDCFASQAEVSPKLWQFARGLRARVRELQPDIVHAHSSIAGAIARVSLSPHDRPIVYTPHCFAFERRDVGPMVRRSYKAIEQLLVARTAAVAACSPREAALAEGMNAPTVYVPNVATYVPGGEPAIVEAKTYVSSGRLTKQKCPWLFAEIAEQVPGAFEWIGGGSARWMQQLQAAGVTVTGWLDRQEALERMRRSSVYIHTAEWEGAPITVLEAAAMGLPVIARDTPALRELGCWPLWSTVDELAAILADDQLIEESRCRSAELTRTHSPAIQAARLSGLYRSVEAAGQLAWVARHVPEVA